MAERGAVLHRHISKSASDLSVADDHLEARKGGKRPRTSSGATAKVTTRHHDSPKTHSFFTTLKNRWCRSKSRERKNKRKMGEDGSVQRDEASTDYTADNSSEHSSSATQSPQHRGVQSQEATDYCQQKKTSDEAKSNKLRGLPTTTTSLAPPVENILPSLPIFPMNNDSKRKESSLRQHSFFQLRIHLKRGVDLIARDKGGTSDPYVKFKVGGRLLYKSKTVYRDLNPTWDESFTIPIEDAFVPVHIKVFDYDWGLQDDFMGSAYLDLTKLDLGKSTEICLELLDPGKTEYLGMIYLTVNLLPKTQEDKDLVGKEGSGQSLTTWTMANRKKCDRAAKFISKIHRLGEKLGKRELKMGEIRVRVSATEKEKEIETWVEFSAETSDATSLKGVKTNDEMKSKSEGTENNWPKGGRRKRSREDGWEWIKGDAAAESSEGYLCDSEKLNQSSGNLDGKGTAADLKASEKLGLKLKVQRYFQKTGRIGEVNRRLKSQIWSSVVTIVLVEGKNLQGIDEDDLSNPYVKFRLGNEKYKSKVAYKNLNPTWLEQFDLHLYDDQNQELEVTIWGKDKSKDDFIGRCQIDLSLLEREQTHGLWQNLEEGEGSIHLLLTISGTTASETISDLTTHEDNIKERQNTEKRYALRNSLHNLRDVGHLTVKVYRATGLAAADLGGKSDPFCVLELVNARLQTQTEYKTLSPSWQKIFTFNVKDINSVLEVTVFDEDRDHKVEFLGKVAIPLLRIRNGEKKWYCLKDKKLRARAKGNCPMILLEMYVVWNSVRACIRTLNPKEEKYMQGEVKFKRQVFVRNVLRLKAIIMILIEWGKFIQECFEWERPAQSIVSLILFIAFCYYFEPYMIPVILLIAFLRHSIVLWLTGGHCASAEEEDVAGEDEEEDDDKDKEEKKSLKDRLQAIQEVTQTVQNVIGRIASLAEQVKNTFNFTVPFISYLAIGLTFSAMIVMYLVPVRYLIMAAGVNRFARKLIRPHTIPNNEVLDLLSRVPDDEDLIMYKEFKPFSPVDLERRRETRKKFKSS